MNYQDLYVNLLLKHGTEEKPTDGEYYEQHHIPKSLGGSNAKENLVYLPGRVHFIVHWMLYKIHKNETMARAFFGMCDFNRNPIRLSFVSSRGYEATKKAFSVSNHMKLSIYREKAFVSAKNQWACNYDRMRASTAFMFQNESHPMYMKGKIGDLHPRSKAVITPLGRFGSVRLAGKAHGIHHCVISRYCKSKDYPEYFYEDQARLTNVSKD